MKEEWAQMDDGAFLRSFAKDYIGCSTITLEDAEYAERRMRMIGTRLAQRVRRAKKRNP